MGSRVKYACTEVGKHAVIVSQRRRVPVNMSRVSPLAYEYCYLSCTRIRMRGYTCNRRGNVVGRVSDGYTFNKVLPVVEPTYRQHPFPFPCATTYIRTVPRHYVSIWAPDCVSLCHRGQLSRSPSLSIHDQRFHYRYDYIYA